MLSLEDKHLIKALPVSKNIHSDFIVCCSHKMLIKCLILIKFVDFVVSELEFPQETTSKFYKVVQGYYSDEVKNVYSTLC